MSAQPQFQDFEVEVTFNVTSTSYAEAEASVARSGLVPGNLIGEALVERVDVCGNEGDL